MVRDAYASLRLPADLKSEVQRIADSQHRSLSNTIQLLLWRGVQEFHKDGVLVEKMIAGDPSRAPARSASDIEAEEFAQDLAREITKFLVRRGRSGEEVPPPKSRDGPKKSRRAAR